MMYVARKPRIPHTSYIILIVISLALSSCFSPSQLRPGENLLYSQNVRGSRQITAEELEGLLPQRPNRRVLSTPLTPALWFYQQGLSRYRPEVARRKLDSLTAQYDQQRTALGADSAARRNLDRRFARRSRKLQRYVEEGNWLMRSFGEPPVYFVETDARANAEKLRQYLFSKGFFLARAAYSLDTLQKRRVRVNYTVQEGPAYRYDTLQRSVADARVDSLLRAHASESLLKSGDRYDEATLAAERVRLETLLRDNGYYGFSRQYVRLQVLHDDARIDLARREPLPDSLYRIPAPGDTVSRDSVNRDPVQRHVVNLNLVLPNPPGQMEHPRFRVGDVAVNFSPATGQPALPPDSVRRDGLRYVFTGPRYSTRLLNSKIRLRPGELYRQRDFSETQRQLFLLNQFRFANVNVVDTTGRVLQTAISATPLDRYEITAESGVTVLYQSIGAPGPFANVALRARNLLGGLETAEISVRYGFELQTGFIATQQNLAYFAQEFGLNTSLSFPQILFPGRGRFYFSQSNPRTLIGLGITSTVRPDYSRRILRGTMAYNWQPSQTQQFSLLPVDVNLLRASFGRGPDGQLFERFINDQAALGSTIRNSFRNAFFSSIGGAYTYNTNVLGQNRRANFVRVAVESGGTTLNLFRDEQLRRFFQTTDTTGLEFYKYLRLNVDFRRYVPLALRTTFAFRLNAGLLFGYGSNQTAPYEKRFFAGGSNSVRAWLPRRLGPGAALPRVDDTGQPIFVSADPTRSFDYSFEQPGDILLEGSAELRGRLFRLGADINGAVFVDAGNVWERVASIQRPGAEFRLNEFYRQIAVGTGVGLRVDFSFFIIRLDAAVKVWDPARRYVTADGRVVDQRYLLPEFSFRRFTSGLNPVTFNFGIGYPF